MSGAASIVAIDSAVLWQCLTGLALVVAVMIFATVATVVVVCPVALAFWALRPLGYRMRARNAWPQFMLADIFALFVVVQGLLSVIVALGPPLERERWHVAPGFLAAAFYAYVWFRGVGHLSAVGVRSAWKRFLILVLVLPGTLLGAVGLLAALVYLAISVWERSLGRSVTAMGISLAVAAAIWLFGFLARALVVTPPSSLPQEDNHE